MLIPKHLSAELALCIIASAHDFAQIARVGISNYVLVDHPSLPVRNVRELVRLGKARPGQLTWASGGAVAACGGAFQSMAGIDIVKAKQKMKDAKDAKVAKEFQYFISTYFCVLCISFASFAFLLYRFTPL